MLKMLCMIWCLSAALPTTYPGWNEAANNYVHPDRSDTQTEHETKWLEISQYFFDDVRFLINYFNIGVWSPKELGYPVTVVAVDTGLNVYPLAGLDSNKYNEMVRAHGIDIHEDRAYQYGRFYLDLCYLYSPDMHYIFRNTEEFVRLQRAMMSDKKRHSFPGKEWETEERRIRDLCEGLAFGPPEYNESENAFFVNYFVWIEGTGQLMHYRLEILKNGECELKSKEVIATDVGYWCGQSSSTDNNIDPEAQQFEQMLQLSLDVDTLQPYFHRLPDSSYYPVIIAFDAAALRILKPNVKKFGHPVRYVSKACADSSNLDSYFWVTEYVYIDSVARIMLRDPVRNISFGFFLQKSGDRWSANGALLSSP